jgi:hypothetical protein
VYHPHCYHTFLAPAYRHSMSPADWCTELETEYCRLYLELESTMLPTSEFHKRTIQTLNIDWKMFRSSRSCLYCLRYNPEHGLQCGHAFCDACACKFGSPIPGMEYSYHVTQCILDQRSGDLRINLKPPTAGSRLLVLDGGGIRGSFTLQALDTLDKYRKLPYPIYDEFDLALGTSTG